MFNLIHIEYLVYSKLEIFKNRYDYAIEIVFIKYNERYYFNRNINFKKAWDKKSEIIQNIIGLDSLYHNPSKSVCKKYINDVGYDLDTLLTHITYDLCKDIIKMYDDKISFKDEILFSAYDDKSNKIKRPKLYTFDEVLTIKDDLKPLSLYCDLIQIDLNNAIKIYENRN